MALVGILCLLVFSGVQADEFSSVSFTVLDPVLEPAGFASSTDFRLQGILGQLAPGTSTASSFNLSSGFLYYPFVNTPVVAASAGDAQVNLSWTASVGVLGWTVASYNIGRSTTSGGPYTYSAVGNVTSSTVSGLSNGTTYYFVVRPVDGLGNALATSSEVSATPAASTGGGDTGTGGGGGGGGGGSTTGSVVADTKVILKGLSYPGARVTVLKDASLAANLIADTKGDWSREFPVFGGVYTFAVYALDNQGFKSITFSFTINVPTGQTVTVSDIIVSPTLTADKSEVKQGNNIRFFGSAYPQSNVNVIINSEHTIVDRAAVDQFGRWSYTLNSQVLERGDHTTKGQTVAAVNLVSAFSQSLAFKVGDRDELFGEVKGVPLPESGCSPRGDINKDGKVNIVDFSIMLFFWNQKNPANPCADINRDLTVNLFDFSIMLYWWTG